jgi:Flp pilus assembly protein TadD
MYDFLSNAFNDPDLIVKIPSTLLTYNSQFNKMSNDDKMKIGAETDNILSLGNFFYRNQDIQSAISHYHLALQSHPLNNDALQNLSVCYEELNMSYNLSITKYAWEIVKDLKGLI